MESAIEALFNYVTPFTIVICIFLPSLWASAAVGVVMAMIGVIVLSPETPNSEVVAGWLIAQTAVAVLANMLKRKAS